MIKGGNHAVKERTAKQLAMSSPYKENEGAVVMRKKQKKAAAKKEEKMKKKKSAARGQSKSCHQCRQSIFSEKGVCEVKQGQLRVKCSQCTRFW